MTLHTTHDRPSGLRPWVPYVLFSLSVWALLLGVYAAVGSFHAEFSGADEAAYVVSGIMTREYLSGPLWHGVSPLAFAQQYYASYPKVAIGHWPPVYFVVQAGWFLLTGVSRPAVLVLSALLSALFASLAVLLCRREGLRWSIAITAGVVTVLLPMHLGSLLEIGSDVITGIAIIVATLACDRWIKQQTPRSGTVFAAAGAVAVLTKGSAFLLALVAPLALVLARRRVDWMWSRDTWRVLVIGVVLALPWYYYTRGWVLDEIVPGSPSSVGSAVRHAIYHNTRILLSLGGMAMLPLALLSLRTRWYGRAPAVAVVPIATWLFLSFGSPHSEPRLFLHVLPIAVFAAAVAANTLLPRRPELLLIGALVVSHIPWQHRVKPAVGFVPAVSWVRATLPEGPGRILVTSNGSGEGAFISELALHQPQPARTIVRGSKILQSSTWMGDDLRLHVRSADDVIRILEQQGVTHVVRHTTTTRNGAMFEESLEEALQRWHLLKTFDEVRIYGRTALP